MIKYEVKLHDFNLHLYQVTLTIDKPLPNQVLMMPTWIPGSYVIRDFAKQLSELSFTQKGQALEASQTKSHEWAVAANPSTPLVVTYLIYAFDKSVRGAYLDAQRGFFNASSLCLCPVGFEEDPYELTVICPKLNWQLVTGLTPQNKTKRYEFGSYVAKNYAQLIDCPVMMGLLVIKSFTVDNRQHDIVVSGDQSGDLDRLAQDVEKICQTQVNFFGGLPKDVDYYCFLLQVSAEGYGGIEHVNSCSLLIQKFAIPAPSSLSEVPPKTKEYIELLGLFSHEYFHLWMVKQIKPSVFVKYDLTAPNYTTQLWAFEGITAYYDDLMLVRAGLITRDQYFAILAENISRLSKTPGRKYQTLKEASFDAWIKFYKPDENSRNTTVSYYLKGALLALCCDLHLRAASENQKSLDDVLTLLWQKYGQTGVGLEENEIEAIIGQLQVPGIPELLALGLDQTEELPLEATLRSFGLNLIDGLSGMTPTIEFGAKLHEVNGQVVCQEISLEGLFQTLGLQVGDMLVACQEHRITHQNCQQIFQRFVNQRVNLTIFRDEKLLNLSGLILPDYVRHPEIKAMPEHEEMIDQWLNNK